MQYVDGEQAHLSPKDLALHQVCRHRIGLELACARGAIQRPPRPEPGAEVLRLRALAHEAAYLEHLQRDRKLQVVRLDRSTEDRTQTLEAMRGGAGAIAQAWLGSGRWRGRADVLLRAPGRSDLGEYHYEVVATWLAPTSSRATVLQLWLCADLLTDLQGRRPERVMVVPPGTRFEPEVYSADHYEADCRRLKAALEAVADAEPETPATYPEPCAHCQYCDWWSVCDHQRHEDDHLSLVADTTGDQRRELVDTYGRVTLGALGACSLPARVQPRRGSREALERAQAQAAAQLRARRRAEPYYELLPLREHEGLCRLPSPSPGDVFLDLVGSPFDGEAQPAGPAARASEYLWGWVVLDSMGRPEYHHLWADHPAVERKVFEIFIDQVMALHDLYPEMHIYHFGSYDPAALKRLLGRHSTRGVEVNALVRVGVFVDLLALTRQAVRVGVEDYSIKNLEDLFGFKRPVELCDVSRAQRTLEVMLEAGRIAEVPAEVREIVRAYNEDDCVSTWRLRQWLEERREEALAQGDDVPRPALPEEVCEGPVICTQPPRR